MDKDKIKEFICAYIIKMGIIHEAQNDINNLIDNFIDEVNDRNILEKIMNICNNEEKIVNFREDNVNNLQSILDIIKKSESENNDPLDGKKRCFKTGTDVFTLNGVKKIEDLSVGDSIISDNTARRITKLYKKEVEKNKSDNL